ncbi:MAG: phosphoglycerate dehydrogenase [Acidimicrobiia bacterium]|nr:phosphoglycerate dehydrogenase [Acidimicrobiia bacterium]
MARILVTEKIAEPGLDALREAGHEVDVRTGLDDAGLRAAIVGAHALIIRSATKVTAEVLVAADELLVVGRAGIGLDNVDVEAATEGGVMVANAPQSNTLTTAEHTMAMLLAQARNIPQAHHALKAGRWERSKWEGVELADKTLGIVGLGRIGKLVAQRAMAFGMNLIAYDPYVSVDRARQINVELVEELGDLVAASDFITLHLVKTPETENLFDAEMLARAKPGLRIVNVSRGGIIDEQALADAVAAGTVAGAALDVFATEPTTESPLFELDQVVVTPHLGASTREAQDKAGISIAEQVGLALAGEFVPFAVNVDAREVAEAVRPFLPLAEKLGAMFASLCDALPDKLEIEFQGEIGGFDNRLTELSVVKGLLGQISGQPVSFVNATRIAEERGMELRTTNTALAKDYVNAITLRGGGHSLAGTLVGPGGEQRLVLIDDHAVYLPPADHLLVIRNDDVPGMIGMVGSELGDAGVNINQLQVGQSDEGVGAIMAFVTAGPVPVEVQDRLRAHDGIVSVRAIDLA